MSNTLNYIAVAIGKTSAFVSINKKWFIGFIALVILYFLLKSNQGWSNVFVSLENWVNK